MHRSPTRSLAGPCAMLMAVLAIAGSARAQSDYALFETIPVRPLALSQDASHLFAVNTADSRVEVFGVGAGGSLTSLGEVQVGLEPVAVAVRGSHLWVTNHLSDSVSRIDVSNPSNPRVTMTIPVGDEPRDIVVGGSAGDKIFVACAHRGQTRPGDPQFLTPGIGRTDVWVLDADAPALAPQIVTLFGDTPRALAVSPDGSEVYAAVMNSGNQTTIIAEPTVAANGGAPPAPPGATAGRPSASLIVKWDGTKWTDEIDRNWNFAVPYSLPDRDVFTLDADADPPVTTGFVTGVGSQLFNMAVNPATGDLVVTGQDARNHVRFEPVLKGHLAEQTLTIVSGSTASPVHLNPHIDYTEPGDAGERALSLALPLDLVFSSDGTRAYIAALGSAKVGVVDATGTVLSRIDVGGGPAGVALDESRERLFVLNHFDKTISVVDTISQTQVSLAELRFDPEPASVRAGRPFLYDAELTSAHGDAACATCHFSADMDRKAWDLGDPFGAIAPNPNPFPIIGSPDPFHPMKGPMATQSLRGMADAGSMHWRGDRNGGFADPLNEDLSFKEFNAAFVTLLGRSSMLTPAEMQAYTDFILQVRYPPNPVAPLNGSLTAAQAAGAQVFTGPVTDTVATCEGCHVLPLGTGGFSNFEGEPQVFKVPHLRNMYAKIGMFRAAGPQVAETGFIHDGAAATLIEFFAAPAFTLTAQQEADVLQFVLAFDTGMAPAVGQQVTATASTVSIPNVTSRIELLRGRDEADDCELVAKARIGGQMRGWVYSDGGFFRSDANAAALVAYDSVRQLASTLGQEVTYTCVYRGGGQRLGVDRDMDGFYDATETAAATDPANASDFPASGSFCGDGATDAGEQCDGGPAGTTCIEQGFAGGVIECDDHCNVDTSGCVETANAFTTRTLRVSGLQSGAGAHKLSLRSGEIAGTGLAFNPASEGMTITLIALGEVLWEGELPAMDSGWSHSAAGWKWRAGASDLATGIRSARVTPGDPFTMQLKARDLDLQGAELAELVTVLLQIGDDTWQGTFFNCRANGNASTLSCAP